MLGYDFSLTFKSWIVVKSQSQMTDDVYCCPTHIYFHLILNSITLHNDFRVSESNTSDNMKCNRSTSYMRFERTLLPATPTPVCGGTGCSITRKSIYSHLLLPHTAFRRDLFCCVCFCDICFNLVDWSISSHHLRRRWRSRSITQQTAVSISSMKPSNST